MRPSRALRPYATGAASTDGIGHMPPVLVGVNGTSASPVPSVPRLRRTALLAVPRRQGRCVLSIVIGAQRRRSRADSLLRCTQRAADYGVARTAARGTDHGAEPLVGRGCGARDFWKMSDYRAARSSSGWPQGHAVNPAVPDSQSPECCATRLQGSTPRPCVPRKRLSAQCNSSSSTACDLGQLVLLCLSRGDRRTGAIRK